MKRPFAVIGFTLFLTLLVLIVTGSAAVFAATLAAAAVGLLAGLCSARLRKTRVLPVVCAVILVGCLLQGLTQQLLYRPAATFAGHTAEVAAVLTEEPQTQYGKQYVTVRLTRIDGEPADLKARLTLPLTAEVAPYDEITGSVQFYLPGAAEETLLRSNRARGIYLACYAVDGAVAVQPRAAGAHRLAMTVIRARQWLRAALYRMLPNRYGAVARAMILGETGDLPPALYNDFRQAGLLHLLCVSGLHLSIWAMLILRLLLRLRVPYRAACGLTALPVLFFMALTGFGYAVIRAGVMLLLFLLAGVLSMRRDPLNSLGAALTVLAVAEPYSVCDVGLLLSASATLGLILYQMFAAPKLRVWTERTNGARIPRILHRTAELLLLTCSVFLFTSPVLLRVYGSVSFAMFPANLLVSPVAGAAMGLTAAGALLGALLPLRFNLPGFFGGLLIKYITAVANGIARVPHLTVTLEPDYACLLMAGTLLFLALAFLLACFGRVAVRQTAVLTALLLIIGSAAGALAVRRETRLRVIDTGNGVSVLLTCRGETYLIGADGTLFNGASNICTAVQAAGGRLDGMLLPAAGTESAAFALDVAQRVPPGMVYADALPYGMELLSLPVAPAETPIATKHLRMQVLRTDGADAVWIQTPDLAALICFGPQISYDALPPEAAGAQAVIFCGEYPLALAQTDCRCAVACAENLRGVLLQEALERRGISAAATAEQGDVLIRASKGSVILQRL